MNPSEFLSPYEWQKFCDYIINENRYVLNKPLESFIETVLVTAKKREHVVSKGSILVRARTGSSWKETENPDGSITVDHWPLSKQDIGAPPPDKTKNGRVNPCGISYLYLSNDIETAIIEVRPWLKQEVTVGYFEIESDLKFVDTSKDKKGYYIQLDPKSKPGPDVNEEQVWSRINDSFSRPIHSEGKHIHYIPTQYLSELFKKTGYDGIIYKSTLTEKGFNVVLYNPTNAQLKRVRTFEIKTIKQTFDECTNSYNCK